jgi:hypothetical protein
VAHGLQRLRLTPKETPGPDDPRLDDGLRGRARGVRLRRQNHNHVTLVSVEEGAQDVVITCRGTVETEDQAG